jgi:hypothetical protein
MSQIDQRIIDSANADIVEVLSRYIDLKKAGREYSACCPFHDERTPSFNVSDKKGVYLCRGCGATGNAISFVMAYEDIPFPAAVERILGRLDTPIQHVTPRAKRIVYPDADRHDDAKSDEILQRIQWVDQHPYLLAANTAPCGQVGTLKGQLAIPLQREGKTVNVAAVGEKVSYAAGGMSFGAVAVLDPMQGFDGRRVLVCDYADAWRVWWSLRGACRVLCAIEPDNFIWMIRQRREEFTHVACYEDERQDLEERGHNVILLQNPYTRRYA